MSRIGNKSIKVPSVIKVELTSENLKISAGSQRLRLELPPEITVEHDTTEGIIRVTRKNNERQSRALHGTIRALIANMITGVTQGYQKDLAVYGTGYGVKQEGNDLLVSAGMAQPTKVAIPVGITIDIKTPNTRGNDVPALFSVKGADKQTVGQLAAEIRRVRPPEPYKGKGVRYADEIIKRKVGKAFASGG